MQRLVSEDHFLIMFRLRFENWSTQGLPVASSLEIMKKGRHETPKTFQLIPGTGESRLS